MVSRDAWAVDIAKRSDINRGSDRVKVGRVKRRGVQKWVSRSEGRERRGVRRKTDKDCYE